MTIALKANAAGTQGEILLNGNPVEVLTASGVQFCKNKLFNGEVTRINQRGFDGNWTPKNTWNSGNTIAQQELCYGYDMWAKASATDMVQPIEAGNFRPSTVHTISGLNMTTRQETSPASGNWNIVVPQAARNVQVEEGSVATPFEIRPISFEVTQCQRYYEASVRTYAAGYSINPVQSGAVGCFKVTKRVGTPADSLVSNYNTGLTAPSTLLVDADRILVTGIATGAEGQVTLSTVHNISAVI